MADDTLTNPGITRADETATQSPNRLIASNRVEGTAVYDRQGEKLGRIENFMVDKRSGQAEYAVMSFGGFLGIGDDHYPIPWSKLTYDTDKGGYVVDLDREKLKEGPKYRADEEPVFDRDYDRRVYDYYGVVYTW
ncbi:MAG TPA: PRC-barrel domain-containing protein [Allosphingosinicella sp.]|nr:PRC-barrel domain-containing protein [Allosphingosinicella sp.]